MTSHLLLLPGPFCSRPLTETDAVEATELIAACERADIGEVYVELEDVRSDWRRPSFDLATESVGVQYGDRLVAVAEVYQGRRAEVYVLPAHRGCGIGSALVRWTWDVARAKGGRLVGQTVPATHRGAVDLLQAHGYRLCWTSWVLELPAGAEIGSVSLPPQVRIRDHVPGEDDRAAYQVIEDAFNEWPDREPSTFADWAAGVTGRGGFEPWNLLLAVEKDRNGDETVVGACHLFLSEDTGWVNQLAVRRDRRGLGLARALLVHAFAAARRHGAQRSELCTDSRTGARGLYERVGMRVRESFVHLARELDDEAVARA